MQDHPVCFLCSNEVMGEEPVFEALCGHHDCASMCWHAPCLMKWRETRDEAERAFTALNDLLNRGHP